MFNIVFSFCLINHKNLIKVNVDSLVRLLDQSLIIITIIFIHFLYHTIDSILKPHKLPIKNCHDPAVLNINMSVGTYWGCSLLRDSIIAS